MTTAQRYPIGIQTFEDIRRDGYVYVDKTEQEILAAYRAGADIYLTYYAEALARFIQEGRIG